MAIAAVVGPSEVGFEYGHTFLSVHGCRPLVFLGYCPGAAINIRLESLLYLVFVGAVASDAETLVDCAGKGALVGHVAQ